MWTTRSARWILGLMMAYPAITQAQSPAAPQVAPPALPGLAPAAEPPRPRQTLAAYQAVDAWVRAWTVAEAGPDNDALPSCFGACVHLRLNGALIGRGTAMVTSAVDPASPDFIRQAAAAAIRSADRRLPVPNDLSRDAAIQQLTPDVQISLELAGAPIPIVEDSWALVDASLSPGLDGLLVRREGAREGEGVAAEFPSQMMLGGGLPQKSLRGMMANVIGEGGAAEVLLMPREIRQKHSVKSYRFRVSHVAQSGRGESPRFLFRGASLTTHAAPSRDSLVGMADDMAAHLLRSIGDAAHHKRSLGVVNLMTGVWTPSTDSEMSLRLAVRAIREYWQVEPARGSAAAEQELNNHGVAIGVVRGPLSPALFLLAPTSTKDKVTTTTRSEQYLLALTKSALSGGEADFAGTPGDIRQVIAERPWSSMKSVERAVVLFACAQWLAEHPKLEGSEAVSTLIRRMYVDTPADRLVSVMPWLGWAELDMAKRRSEESGRPVPIPAAIALRAMRDEVWKHQLTILDAGDDGADMVGGIVFTSGNTSPLPTWQCVRPLAFMGTMLGDERLTEPHERALELARLLQAMRFLRQLQVDESCGWMYPDPKAAIGGIRGAVWDHTLNPDATSLTLLAVVELLKSMDRIGPEMLKEAAPAK